MIKSAVHEIQEHCKCMLYLSMYQHPCIVQASLGPNSVKDSICTKDGRTTKLCVVHKIMADPRTNGPERELMKAAEMLSELCQTKIHSPDDASNGAYLDVSTTDTLYTYTCHCATGYTGTQCATDNCANPQSRCGAEDGRGKCVPQDALPVVPWNADKAYATNCDASSPWNPYTTTTTTTTIAGMLQGQQHGKCACRYHGRPPGTHRTDWLATHDTAFQWYSPYTRGDPGVRLVGYVSGPIYRHRSAAVCGHFCSLRDGRTQLRIGPVVPRTGCIGQSLAVEQDRYNITHDWQCDCAGRAVDSLDTVVPVSNGGHAPVRALCGASLEGAEACHAVDPEFQHPSVLTQVWPTMGSCGWSERLGRRHPGLECCAGHGTCMSTKDRYRCLCSAEVYPPTAAQGLTTVPRRYANNHDGQCTVQCVTPIHGELVPDHGPCICTAVEEGMLPLAWLDPAILTDATTGVTRQPPAVRMFHRPQETLRAVCVCLPNWMGPGCSRPLHIHFACGPPRGGAWECTTTSTPDPLTIGLYNCTRQLLFDPDTTITITTPELGKVVSMRFAPLGNLLVPTSPLGVIGLPLVQLRHDHQDLVQVMDLEPACELIWDAVAPQDARNACPWPASWDIRGSGKCTIPTTSTYDQGFALPLGVGGPYGASTSVAEKSVWCGRDHQYERTYPDAVNRQGLPLENIYECRMSESLYPNRAPQEPPGSRATDPQGPWIRRSIVVDNCRIRLTVEQFTQYLASKTLFAQCCIDPFYNPKRPVLDVCLL
jgi:hypothetical protein